jgi:hypothetical protein
MTTCPAIINFTPGPALDSALAWTARDPAGIGFREHLRAVAAGRIALTAVMHRRVAWMPRSLKSSLPTIVLIGDDHGDSRNPDEWRCSMSAIAWARSAIIHGTGAQAWHYAEAVRAAELTGRCLFIETDSAHVAAWLETIMPRQIPVLSIAPPPGTGPHPVPARGCRV